MKNLKHKIAYSALGASGGLLGASSIGACAGAACASCLGCVGAGAVLAVALLINKVKRAGKGEEDAVA
jgi:hypothetical protein